MNSTRFLDLNPVRGRFRMGRGDSRARLRNQVISDRQYVHMRAQETIDGLLGCANNRLVVIKGSIDDRRRARELAEFFDQSPESRIGFAIDGL